MDNNIDKMRKYAQTSIGFGKIETKATKNKKLMDARQTSLPFLKPIEIAINEEKERLQKAAAAENDYYGIKNQFSA